MNSNFKLWLDQPVTFLSGICMQRREFIPIFKTSIECFLQELGYTLNWEWDTNLVAKWLYAIHIRVAKGDTSPFPYKPITHRDTFDDLIHYNNIIEQEYVTAFFEEWNHCSDIGMDTFIGDAIREELCRFLWNYIDLDTSYQGQMVESILYPESESDSDSIILRKGDNYVQDASEGYHG